MDCPKFQKPGGEKKKIFALCWSVIKSLAYIFCWFIFLSVLLAFFTSFSSCSGAFLSANKAAVAHRGLDIHAAITNANALRKTMDLPPIWPKTFQVFTNDTVDISDKVFKTSTEYFEALYLEEIVAPGFSKPWVRYFDYSKLAGAGVSEKKGKGKLQAKNNMWLIAANITEDDSDLVPLLITRNVDVKEIERVVNCGGDTSNLNEMIALGKGDYKTPFGEKAFVVVRKGGGTFSAGAKYARIKCVFNSQTLPPRDPSKPPIVYLMP